MVDRNLKLVLYALIILILSPYIAGSIFPASEKYFRYFLWLLCAVIALYPFYTKALKGTLTKSKSTVLQKLGNNPQLFRDYPVSAKLASVLAASGVLLISTLQFIHAK